MFERTLLEEFFKRSGKPIDAEQLSELLPIINTRSSLSPSEKLRDFCEGLGIKGAKVRQAVASQLDPNIDVCLVFIELSWMILERSVEGFTLNHPVTGEKKLTDLSELPVTVAMWLELDREGSRQTHGEDHTVFSLIRKYAFNRTRWVFDICTATVMVNFLAVVSSLFAMQVYDRVVPSLAFETLHSLVAGVLIIYLIDFALKILRSRLLDRTSCEVDKKLSLEVFKHLTNVQLDKLPPQVGTLTAQISGIDSARQFFTSTVVFILVDLPFAFLFLAIIYTVGGPIVAVYAGFFVISMIVGYLAQKRSKKLSSIITMRSNEKLGVLVDTIKGAETLKSTGAERQLQSEWETINKSIAEYNIKHKSITQTATTLSQSLGSLAYVAAVVIGVYQISLGNMTMGSMIACSILGGRVLGPVGQAVSYLVQWETVRQSISLVDKFLEIPKERSSNNDLTYPVTRAQSVSVESLEFAYQGSQVKQLDIGNLSFKAGERVAILGAIGSGKSTLLKILAGLYHPSNGLIKIEGADLWSLSPEYLRKNVGYLPQTPDLFKGTLLSNLKLGSDASDTKVLGVIQNLGLGSVVNGNEKGLELPISEGGAGLSGGQRQLVGLARLFIRAPAIWLLDEPTSSLDPDSQERVKNNFKQLLNKSDILIFATHNPKLAKDLGTRLLIMDKGKIVKDVPASAVTLRSVN